MRYRPFGNLGQAVSAVTLSLGAHDIAWVRQQLQATALGVGMHPMSQAVQEFAEMAPHFERVHQLVLGRPAPRTPQEPTVQMFCRIGYPQGEVPATPRRPLARFVQA